MASRVRFASAVLNFARIGFARRSRHAVKRIVKSSVVRKSSLEQLESRELFAVTYHGGALLSHVETQAVYVGANWSSTDTLASQRQQVDQYLNYLVQSPYMDMLSNAGYDVGRGSSSPGQQIALGLSAGSNVSDSQIQNWLQNAISSGELQQPDANRLYLVYFQPGVSVQMGKMSSRTDFAGYHGAFAGKDINNQAVDIRYAVLPYPGYPNPTASSQGYTNSLDQLTAVTSHELVEAVTDPDVNYRKVGWYDDSLNGEIGDLTRQTTKLSGYTVQAVVDKNDRVIFPSDSSVTPTPTPSPVPIPSPPLSAPTNLVGTAISNSSAHLTWRGGAKAWGYRIYEVGDSGKGVLLGTVGSDTTSVDIKNLVAGTVVAFYVQAFNGTSIANSSTASVNLPAAPSLLPPIVSASELRGGVFNLAWSRVDGAEGYRIFQVIGNRLALVGTVDAQTVSANISIGATRVVTRWLVQAYSGQSVANSSPVVIGPNRTSSWFEQWVSALLYG